MGTKRVRLANLPPETPDEAVRFAFSTYGEIKEIQEENLSRAYRYQVANGIRVVLIALTKHIPSHMKISGNRVLVSYEGQPSTCYGCGEAVHLYLVCPRRRKVAPAESTEPTTSWADIAARGYRSPTNDGGERKDAAGET
jgi:hypothetical protein